MLLTALLPDLLLYVPGCPTPVATYALLESARRFCRQTYIITQDSGQFSTYANVNEIDLSDYADTYTEAIGVRTLSVNGQSIIESPMDLVRSMNRFTELTPPGRPRTAWQTDETTLILYPTPDQAYTIEMTIAVAPSPGATYIDDTLCTRWKDAVVGGALERLCAQPNQPYMNAPMAALGKMQFSEGVSKARIEVNRSYARTERLRPVPLAWGRKWR